MYKQNTLGSCVQRPGELVVCEWSEEASPSLPPSKLLWELCVRTPGSCFGLIASLITFPSDMKSVLQDPELSLLQRCLLVSRWALSPCRFALSSSFNICVGEICSTEASSFFVNTVHLWHFVYSAEREIISFTFTQTSETSTVCGFFFYIRLSSGLNEPVRTHSDHHDSWCQRHWSRLHSASLSPEANDKSGTASQMWKSNICPTPSFLHSYYSCDLAPRIFFFFLQGN